MNLIVIPIQIDTESNIDSDTGYWYCQWHW